MKRCLYIAIICTLQTLLGVIITKTQWDLIYDLFVVILVGFTSGIFFGLLGEEYKK